MNIEIGEYVRTKKGNIGKVLDITTCTGQKRKKYLIKWNIVKVYYITGATIVKHSPDIIDLIEPGDYVNGGKVVEHAHEKGRLFVSCTYVGGIAFTTFEDYSWELTKNREEDIETIVTKQQFSNMEYRV